jgi:hypothetical protein
MAFFEIFKLPVIHGTIIGMSDKDIMALQGSSQV